MAKLTNEQIEQNKQLLAEKMKAMKAHYNELAEAGAIELTDEELDGAAGGGMNYDPIPQCFTDYLLSEQGQ